MPDYALVNLYAFAEPIAPHLAAGDAGVEIRLDPIVAAFAALSTNIDCVVIEGVGGWAVPLSPTLMQADLVRALKLPVILVVGLRLGCINHALLSARAIVDDGCKLIGWIGNRIDPEMARIDDNIATLRARLPAPCLGVLPASHQSASHQSASHQSASHQPASHQHDASAPDPSALAPYLRNALAIMQRLQNVRSP
jgi:dethiobiotin synthetase